MRFWGLRVGMLIALLLAVSMLTFGAMNLLGDPLFNILGPVAGDTENPENLAKIQRPRSSSTPTVRFPNVTSGGSETSSPVISESGSQLLDNHR